MTLFHFMNCAALTFVPALIVYHTKLSDSGRLWMCTVGALAFLLTKLVEMILLATFVPAMDGDQFSFIQEIFKSLVSCADLAGMSYVIAKHREWLPIGFGWAVAESIVSRLVPLWIGARSLEFDWTYIQTSIQASFALLAYISLAQFVRLWRKRNHSFQALNIVIPLALNRFFLPILVSFLKNSLNLSWIALAVEGGGVVLFYLLSAKVVNDARQGKGGEAVNKKD